MFLGRYKKLLHQLQSKEVLAIDQYKDDDLSFTKFETMIDEAFSIDKTEYRSLSSLRDEYAMFSNSTDSGRDILSLMGQSIDLSKLYTRDENFGMYLDLSKYYVSWLNVIKNADTDMLSFLRMLESFQSQGYLTKPITDRNGTSYTSFLREILKYFKAFHSKVYPLIDKSITESKIRNTFSEYTSTGVYDKEKPGKVFCVVCDKWFMRQSVFDSHLSGTKHTSHLDKRRKALLTEYSVHCYTNYLSAELKNTRSFTERKLAFTDEELSNELEKLQEQYESPLYGVDEKENVSDIHEHKQQEAEVDPANPYNLPKGPDGLPIPRWLFKLQGLDVKYHCEICGNAIYQGRREYEKHFHSYKHSEGLKSLGIEPSPAFKDVPTIEEAKALWTNLKAKGSASSKRPSEKMSIEAEDEEGNVMSIEVYEELKKQGIL